MGGYGNPFGVKTLSGNPLADDFATVVVRGLADRGFKAAAVTVAPTDTPEQVREQVLAAGKDRNILITLDRWNSDTYQAVRLIYSVRAEVLAPDGTVLGSKTLDFKGGLGSGGMNPPKRSCKYIPRAYEQAVEDLLNADTIVAALQSP